MKHMKRNEAILHRTRNKACSLSADIVDDREAYAVGILTALA
jgi:hypothetical protein